MWERCPVTNKPEVCTSNLWKLRTMFAGVVVGGGVLGYFTLPWLGFDAGGVVTGTIASAWQSSIGNVAAGSLFSAITSLGMTGYGVLMFGSVGAGLGLLATLAIKLDWCTCQYDKSKADFKNI